MTSLRPDHSSPPRRLTSIGAAAVLAVALGLVAWAVLHPAPGTAAQSQYAPTSTTPPTITGTPAEGAVLTANEGTWQGDALVFTYQWQRCNASGGACTAIPGATAKTYVVPREQVGATLRVAVTARNAQGAATATSGPTAVVSGPPRSITLPSGQSDDVASRRAHGRGRHDHLRPRARAGLPADQQRLQHPVLREGLPVG